MDMLCWGLNDWRKQNDLSFYLYCTFCFYASNHTRGEQEIMGKTKSKIKKKKTPFRTKGNSEWNG